MSRKELIITALLVNIGVLVLLLMFATSGQKEKSVPEQTLVVESISQIDIPSEVETKKTAQASNEQAFDEIDRLLEEYVTTDAPQVAASKKQPSVLVPLKPKEGKKKVEPPPTDDCFYTVKSGDNPWKIARKFHISFEKLLELNNLNEAKARNLKIGQKLKIRE